MMLDGVSSGGRSGEVSSTDRVQEPSQDRCDREHVSYIRQFCREIPASVRVIAVTKQVSTALMRSAYEAGIRDFGENRVQEALQKQQELHDLTDIQWHFIGHLQSNKALKVVQHFDWIQSVDTLALAERIDRHAQAEGKTIQVCLQVKLRPDDTKSGLSPDELRRSMPHIAQLPALRIQGLMLIPPASLDSEALLIYFKEAALLAQELELKQLSMGMSSDYPIAIQCGATMIRPGRVLFGQRV
jgi:PLP dependent protein